MESGLSYVESKLHIIGSLLKKKIIKELLPKIMLRYIGEEDLRTFQREGVN